MKVDLVNNTKFKPFTITVETIEEAKMLYTFANFADCSINCVGSDADALHFHNLRHDLYRAIVDIADDYGFAINLV